MYSKLDSYKLQLPIDTAHHNATADVTEKST